MKLRTFLAFGGIGAVGFAALGGGAIALMPPVEIAAPAAVPTPAPAVPVDAPSGRAVDRVVLGYRGKNLGADKLKDVSAGQSFKVNVYQDAGEATANRAKVDLDRDEKWDEKYTFGPDGVEREVAPNDDEAYSEVWTWTGSGWARK
jgi:hypothetical protein